MADIVGRYEVRVIIHNTYHVQPADRSMFDGDDGMSDIYVKSWVKGMNDIQKTDIHFRAQDGEGNFNWRFVFPIEYFPTEQAIIVEDKVRVQ